MIRPRMFLGENLSLTCQKAIEALGYEVRLLPPCKELQAPVATHPDMLMCQIGDTLIVPRSYYLENKSVFDGVCVTLADVSIQPEYPRDVCMNALIMGDTLYGRVDVICGQALDMVKNHVFTKQGYAACSTLKITENAAVTADKSIAKALSQNGVDVCLIRSGHIKLDGYDYGFIGGASVKLLDGSVAFFGDLSGHPDHEKIQKFAQKHNTRLISLSDDPLEDHGGGKCIK